MKYLKAVISSDALAQDVLYRKDFRVYDVCAPFVRGFASTLVSIGFLIHQEDYKAYVIPHYGAMPPQVVSSKVERMLDIKRDDPWINLYIEEAIQPEKSIDYFTVYVLPKEDILSAKEVIMRGQDLIITGQKVAYRIHVSADDLTYFWRRIERTLSNLGPAEYQERHYRKLYVRDDDHANLEYGEVTALERDAAELIQLIPGEDISFVFPQKSLTDFTIIGAKKLVRGVLTDDPSPLVLSAPGDQSTPENQKHTCILITRPVLEQLQQIARSGVRVEQGGSLVGSVYEESSTHDYLVEISDYIPTEGAVANEIELRYTFESWQHQTTLLKERFPGKRIVGWYHTHLAMVKKTFRTKNQGTYTSPIFFSKDDHFTHRQFFREKWYVAMVLDPEGNLTFFQWIGDDVGESSGFYVIEPVIEPALEPGKEE